MPCHDLPTSAGMSCPPTLMPDPLLNDSSDYGSDFTPDEEEALNDLLAQVATDQHATTSIAAISTPEDTAAPQPPPLQTVPPVVRDIEDYNENPATARLPRVLGRQKPPWQVARTAGSRAGQIWSDRGGTAIVEHPNSTEGRTVQRAKDVEREQQWINNDNATTNTDPRTPIERFRRPPNKAFSVTDLISPAWCELQYWYTLTKHGRKRRTPAMKLGSNIHKTLEDKIYTTVPVEVTTKEDALALRVWNVIQGLRLLREYGITRELEVWGLVDGELVNGVIDQLSYECPDSGLEATAASYYADIEASRAVMPEYQMSLSDYLLSPSHGGRRLSDLAWHDEMQPGSEEDSASLGSGSASEVYNIPRVYLTDIKTRASGSAPSVKSTGFRPTLLQLQMYYHMLNRLTTSDEVSIELLAVRYGFDPNRTFTDAFISEVGGLNDQFFDAPSSPESDPEFTIPTADADSSFSASQDSTSVLLTHNNLSSLWSLMKDQLKLTFLPDTNTHPETHISVAPSIPSEFQPSMLESYPTVLSPVLTARYLSSAATDSEPRVLGDRSFLFDPTTVTSYLSDQMEWWRGERSPRGVEVMEAWKCRICEFNDDCSWRQERELEFASRARRRRLEPV